MPALPIPDRLMPALRILYARLHDAPFDWSITGSLSMRLQGMDLDVHDIDLSTEQSSIYALEDRLREYVCLPVEWKPSPGIRSFFGVLEIAASQVEIMGGLEHLDPEQGWLPSPPLSEARRWADYEGMRLPVTGLERLHWAYVRMGRAAKAAQIRAFIDQLPAGS